MRRLPTGRCIETGFLTVFMSLSGPLLARTLSFWSTCAGERDVRGVSFRRTMVMGELRAKRTHETAEASKSAWEAGGGRYMHKVIRSCVQVDGINAAAFV